MSVYIFSTFLNKNATFLLSLHRNSYKKNYVQAFNQTIFFPFQSGKGSQLYDVGFEILPDNQNLQSAVQTPLSGKGQKI